MNRVKERLEQSIPFSLVKLVFLMRAFVSVDKPLIITEPAVLSARLQACVRSCILATISAWSKRSYSNGAVFLEYAKMKQAKERLCWQDASLAIQEWVNSTSPLFCRTLLLTRRTFSLVIVCLFTTYIFLLHNQVHKGTQKGFRLTQRSNVQSTMWERL